MIKENSNEESDKKSNQSKLTGFLSQNKKESGYIRSMSIPK